MSSVVGCVLAGGLSRRMGGGDKGLLAIAGRPILAQVIERLRPQVARLILNANGDPSRFARFELPVVPDSVEGFAGPLAGVLAALEWTAANEPEAQWVATAATDSPFFPDDLVSRLLAACADGKADLAVAASNGRTHPVFGLWPVTLVRDLRIALVREQVRKVDVWTARYRLVEVGFSRPDHDPFFNANRPEDLAEAERLLDVLEA